MPVLPAAGDARIHYDVQGDGPTVVLVHGGTGTGAHDWEHQRGPLAERHRLVIPDLRGHGRSDDPGWLLSLAQIGDDVASLVDRIGRPADAIVGFSVGASALLRVLARESGLTRCAVLIGASVRGHPERVPGIVEGPWPSALTALEHEHGSGPGHWRDCAGAWPRAGRTRTTSERTSWLESMSRSSWSAATATGSSRWRRPSASPARCPGVSCWCCPAAGTSPPGSGPPSSTRRWRRSSSASSALNRGGRA